MLRSSLVFGLAAGLAALASFASCVLPFEDYDPRVGGGGSVGLAGGTSPNGGGGATTSSTSSGGQGADGGTTTTSSSGAAGSGGAPGGSGGAGGGGAPAGGGGAAPIEDVTFVATVADCVNPNDPDPDVCAATSGVNVFTVDQAASGLNNDPAYGFVRFDPDSTISGHTVVAAEVRLYVGTDVDAVSDESGALWLVTEFSRSSLFGALPTQSGGAPLGASQPATVAGQTIVWPVSVDLVVADQPLCLGIYPESANGVDYQNLSAGSPPLLYVEYQ